jgi:hypothetical protein
LHSADLEYPLWSRILSADQHLAARSFLPRDRLCDGAMAIVVDGMTPIHSKAAREDNQQASEVALSVNEQVREQKSIAVIYKLSPRPGLPRSSPVLVARS